jgi:hypothetical protein
MEPERRDPNPSDDGRDLSGGQRRRDPVQEAEEQSFPASDPPSWWSG